MKTYFFHFALGLLMLQGLIATAQDHPLLSRYEGSKLISQGSSRYASYPTYDYESYEWGNIEGKFESYIYKAPDGLAILEIHANYEKALEKAGFQKVQQKRGNAELYKYTDQIKESGLQMPEDHYSNIYIFNGYYSWYKKEGMQVVIMSADQEGKVYTSLDFIGEADMELGKVKADANAIASAINKEGKISIYGITFSVGSASIQPASKETLGEIAKFLKANPTIKLYIVGHTDDTGSLQNNLSLSENRAKSVAEALASEYGISASRLSPSGVGPYAPVASNLTEAGKAKNRRVELVRRLK